MSEVAHIKRQEKHLIAREENLREVSEKAVGLLMKAELGRQELEKEKHAYAEQKMEFDKQMNSEKMRLEQMIF